MSDRGNRVDELGRGTRCADLGETLAINAAVPATLTIHRRAFPFARARSPLRRSAGWPPRRRCSGFSAPGFVEARPARAGSPTVAAASGRGRAAERAPRRRGAGVRMRERARFDLHQPTPGRTRMYLPERQLVAARRAGRTRYVRVVIRQPAARSGSGRRSLRSPRVRVGAACCSPLGSHEVVTMLQTFSPAEARKTTPPPGFLGKPRGAQVEGRGTFSYFARHRRSEDSVASSRSRTFGRSVLIGAAPGSPRLGRRSLRLASLIGAASGPPRLGRRSLRLASNAVRPSRGRKCRGRSPVAQRFAASPIFPIVSSDFSASRYHSAPDDPTRAFGATRSRRRCSFRCTPCASWSPRPSSANQIAIAIGIGKTDAPC